MLKDFIQFIEKEKLLLPGDKVILGVSGGIDSMVMLDLFSKSNYQAGIAHCNFNLRGKESDEDERFVARSALDYRLPFYSRSFNTLDFASKEKISVQMAARNLRYDWFRSLLQSEGYQYIGLGHNSDDDIETVLLNLIRGTGLKGLTGIKPRSEPVIRPLLFASRTDIIQYAREHNVNFREDSSNNSIKYKRNKIRHELIPLAEQINPSFRTTMQNNMRKFMEAYRFFDKHVTEKIAQVVKKENDEDFLLDVKMLFSSGIRDEILSRLLREKGFSPEMIMEINRSLDKIRPGMEFSSGMYRLVTGSDNLRLVKKKHSGIHTASIDNIPVFIENPVSLEFNYVDQINTVRVRQAGKSEAYLDADKLSFPLEIRPWKSGDSFIPLGMKGHKKVSDYLTDIKHGRIEKEKTHVLTSGDSIVWLIGERIDERYKLSESTRKILHVKVI